MSNFKIQPATRQGVKPLIVPYSESGCGKTMSALLLARGLAGPKGKIVVADSESRRASLYADVIPGGFETFDLCEPFSPARYIEAVDTIENSGAACGIIDSGSHEWDGPGSVLDMAGENERKSGKAGLHNWRLPKLEHAKFVQRLLRTKIPFIICLRAKYKTKQGKDRDGKTVIVRDDYISPIQAEDFIFEATVHMEILQDHSIRLTKCSHPALKDCFPAQGPIKIEHGAMLAAWCDGTAAPKAKPAPVLDRNKLLVELRDITSDLHKWEKGMTAKQWQIAKGTLQDWLTEECGIKTTLDQMTPEQLAQTIEYVKKAIKEIPK